MRVLAGLVFTVCLFAATPAYAADQVVVRFSRSADSADRSAARASVDATAAEPVTGLTGVQVVTVPEGDAKSATRTLDNTDGVLWAQPRQRMHIAAAMPSAGGNQSGAQWGLLNGGQSVFYPYSGRYVSGTAGIDGNFTPAWDNGTGEGATIAIVDTGVDFNITDLADNQDATDGHDFVDGDDDPSPDPTGTVDTSHGTHVAGIAAASMTVHDSVHDIVGGAPDAHVMALRALDGTGAGYDTDIAAAFDWAASHGAQVVNASLGGTGWSDVLHDAIASNPDTLFVVAAGNDGRNEDPLSSDDRDYPCTDPSPNVICVAAVTSTGALASFSNYGATTVDVGAPGQDIISYVLGGTLKYWDGTSMATPFVSAAAALAFGAHPEATAAQVRDSILASAKPLPALCGKVASGGMIDANAVASLNMEEPAPHACGRVTLSSTAPRTGAAVTASGSFDRGTVTWQWQRCATTCASIAGATHSTYVPQAADVGQRLQVTATATNGTGATPSTSALTSAVTAPAPKPTPIAPKSTPVATPTPKPAPTPIAKPAAPASPKLSLYRPHRRGSKLAISGRVVRSFHGNVTVKLCAGRHCRTVRLRVRNGAFSAKVRPPRHGRIVITASVPASAGHRAGHAKRTVRF